MLHPSPLVTGKLIKRYKRFLADVKLDTGEEITASCPNTGSMLGLIEPGNRVWLSVTDKPGRKYRHRWEMVEIGGTIVGINTSQANIIVREAIEANKISELTGYDTIRNEVKYGQNSRIDLLLSTKDKPDCYVEVKNVTLSRQTGLAEFPDAITTRGTKHLKELSAMVGLGARAVMLYLVQRADSDKFRLSGDIDPAYLMAYSNARKQGVEIIAYSCHLNDREIVITRPIQISN